MQQAAWGGSGGSGGAKRGGGVGYWKKIVGTRNKKLVYLLGRCFFFLVSFVGQHADIFESLCCGVST